MIILNAIILLVLDIYIYKGLRATSISFVKKPIFPKLWWGYSIFLLVGIFISIYVNIPLAIRSIIMVAFFITFCTKFIFMLTLLLDDIRRGGVWIKRLIWPNRTTLPLEAPLPEAAADQPPKKDVISRSEFLMKSGLVVASIPLVTLTMGVISGAYDYRIRRQKLYLPNLPDAFHGMKIGQLSDIHSGSFYNKKAVLGGIELLLAEKPDMVFFTGDLVNHLAAELKDYQDIFGKVKAPLGVFSVLGNHDYGDYHFGGSPSVEKAKNFQDLKNAHRIMGWDLLLNEHRRVKVDNEEIGILGVENWGTGRFPKHGDLAKTLQETDDLPVKLLLSHDPSHWRAQVMEHPDIDVTFSGHTHGMQFGVRAEHFQWSPVQYIYKEWAGLYRENGQQLYVNTGFGFLGYPGRVGILPEITIFELMKGESPQKG